MLVRLKPRGQIYRHFDRGDYYQVRDRFHVMLHSPEGCWLECGDERWVTRTGQIVWFDNKSPYEEGNPSDQWSVRLIVDILPKPRPPVPSAFKNFALMKAGVDVGPLLEELDSQPQLWDADTADRATSAYSVRRATSRCAGPGADSRWCETNRLASEPSHSLCRSLSADLRVGRTGRAGTWRRSLTGERGSTQPARKGLPACR